MTVDENFVTAGGFVTRFMSAGMESDSTVVLIHDGAWGGCSSVTWDAVIPILAQSFRVIAPDLLGFGGTDKAVFFDRSPYEFRIRHLWDLLDTLGIDGPVHLIGNSFGGSMALRMLAADDQRIRSVVSIAGTGGPWRTELALDNLGRWDGTEIDLRRIVTLLVGDGPVADEHLAKRHEWASVPGHYRATAAPGSTLPHALTQSRPADPWPKQLDGCSTPVMLVAGSDDALLDKDWPGHFQDVLQNCDVRWLNCRHLPNVSHPRKLAGLVSEFLRNCDKTVDHGSRST